MFIKRKISKNIISGASQVPVIAIIGPRQSGKSTLAKEIFPNHIYVDMQDAEITEFANQDPKGFLNIYKNQHGIIVDEAQYAPKLFSQIKVEADKDPKHGYYILSGSQNFLLHEKISESLAGRVYFYILLPLSIAELKNAKLLFEKIEDQIIHGFYPRVYMPKINSLEYYKNYISTYVERDIRSVRNIDNILVFNKFMQLCALNIGNTINFANLALDCGISVNTAKNWLSLLQTSFILFLLPSYHDNLGKRVTKSPKLYFYDVGLACNLMGIDKEILIQKRNIYGALFENLIIVDLIKNLNTLSVRYNLSFYRDISQKEIDLIIEYDGKVVPIEIKSSQTMDTHFFDTINWFKEQIKNVKNQVVIYGGDLTQTRSAGKIINWKDTETIINNLTKK